MLKVRPTRDRAGPRSTARTTSSTPPTTTSSTPPTTASSTPPTTASSPRPAKWVYVPELDGLRAFAVAAVVGSHYEVGWFPGGYLGVPMFFVLSGYLITGLLSTEFTSRGDISYRSFYIRRALRLYPALVTAVLVGLLVAFAVGHTGVSAPRMVAGAGASLSYINDFIFTASPGDRWFRVTWSLGIEEQFYLLWPFLLTVGLRTIGVRKMAYGTLGVALAIGVLYVPLRSVTGPWWVGFSPIAGMMPLLLGAAAFWLRPCIPGWLAALAGGVLLALVLHGPANLSSAEWEGAQQIAALCTAALIAYLVRAGSTPLRSGPVVWLGRRSYGLYLIHDTVAVALLNAFPSLSGSVDTLIGVPLSLLLTAASYRFVEQPFLRRKVRFARVEGAASADLAVAGSAA